MTALELVRLVNQVFFVGLFVAVLVAAVRQPSRARADAVLLFGSAASVVILARVADWLGLSGNHWVTSVTLLLLTVAPLAMLRLVDDFSDSPRWVQRVGVVAFIAVGVLGFVLPITNDAVLLATMAFLVAVGGYAAFAFARQSRLTRGITSRRMTAVAVGAGAFMAALFAAFLGAFAPGIANVTGPLVQLLALLAVTAFFLGFTPPRWVRLVWRDPDVRRFLERSTQIMGVTDDYLALTQMQAAAADAFGATGAVIGIAVPERRTLRYAARSGWEEYPDDEYVAGRAFTERRRVVVADSAAFDPENVEAYQRVGARTVIATPIATAEGEPLGVLTIFASRAPVFAEDDLWLLDLLASHTGVLLEARSLSAQASELRAREDAARLKEEFISAAAHDLRTPLTVVLGQAELLQRRLQRRPDEPADPASVGRIVREAHRLRDLVIELLDSQRLEESRDVLRIQRVDLRHVVEAVVDRHREYGAVIGVDMASPPLRVDADGGRLEQVVENLVENAVKYGGDTAPSVRAWLEGDQVVVSVVDHGIGIPAPERERVFERFYRASNAHSITDTGIGLGLYICRRIVEAHGGRIWFEPTAGGGSTFTFSLPLAPERVEASDLATEPVGDATPPLDPAWNPTPALSTDSAHADA